MTRWSEIRKCAFSLAVAVLFVTAVFAGSSLRADTILRTIQADVVYGHKAGMALTFDVIQPAPEHRDGSAVVFMASGGWFSGWFPPESVVREETNRPNLFEQIVASGRTLYIVRHGSAPYFKVPDAVADVRRAWQFIVEHADQFGVDPKRIAVMGMSAGGHLSLVLGTDDSETHPAAVAVYFPPVDLRDYVGPSKDFPALDFSPDDAPSVSPILHVDEGDSPALLIHGDADRLVPVDQSHRMHDALREAGVACELVVLPGARHGFSGTNKAEAETAVMAWLDRWLGAEEQLDAQEVEKD